MKKDSIAQISKDELSKVEGNLLNPQQLNLLLSPTPPAHIYKRPAKGGGEWSYVTGTYVKKVLNLMFGWDWSFEIIAHETNLEFKQVIVKGKLTVHSNGRDIVKMQFGRQDVKFRKQTDLDKKNGVPAMPLDLGNDLKGATTDALKKCAAELGIASDVYAPNEFKAVQVLPEREYEELKALIDNVQDFEELEMLCESFTRSEMKLVIDLVEATKSDFLDA